MEVQARSVILSSNSAIPAQWLQDTIRSYKEADDVFTGSFLKHVFIISNVSISNSTVNLFIRDTLNSWGADLAVILTDGVDPSGALLCGRIFIGF